MWKDVLRSLKDSMSRLQWVSLRRIGYVPQFGEMDTGGAEVPEDQPWALSDSDTDDDEDIVVAGPSGTGNNTNRHHASTNGLHNGHTHLHYDSDDTDSMLDTDNEHEPEDNATDFPNLDSPTTAEAPPFSNGPNHDQHMLNGDLDDDGYSVSNAKRKSWEQWVTNSSNRHTR